MTFKETVRTLYVIILGITIIILFTILLQQYQQIDINELTKKEIKQSIKTDQFIIDNIETFDNFSKAVNNIHDTINKGE